MAAAHATHLYLHLLHTTSYYFLMRATRMHVVLYIQTTEKQRISVHIQTMNNPDAAAAADGGPSVVVVLRQRQRR